MYELVCLDPGCSWPICLCAFCVSPCKCLLYETDPGLPLGSICNSDVLCQIPDYLHVCLVSEMKKIELRNPVLGMKIEKETKSILSIIFLFSVFMQFHLDCLGYFFKLSMVLLLALLLFCVLALCIALPFLCDLATISKKACMWVLTCMYWLYWP